MTEARFTPQAPGFRLFAWCFCACLLALSCVEVSPGPGDESMGNFQFTAQLLAAPDGGEPFPRCTYQEFGTDSFEFTARFARYRDGGQAFITIGGVDRTATFDGQVLTGTNDPARPSTRVYTPANSACTCTAKLTETLTVALLSASQDSALLGTCPPEPLDGGVPGPTPDGGIVRPATTPAGFDAVTACGELTNVVSDTVATDECDCQLCLMRYSVRGVRR